MSTQKAGMTTAKSSQRTTETQPAATTSPAQTESPDWIYLIRYKVNGETPRWIDAAYRSNTAAISYSSFKLGLGMPSESMQTDRYIGNGVWELYSANMNACCVIQRHPVDKGIGTGLFGHAMRPTEPNVVYLVCAFQSGQVEETGSLFWTAGFGVLQVCKNQGRAYEAKEEHHQKIVRDKGREDMWVKAVEVEVY
ncbi:MAG: hypothetical protein Q9226_002406 [Calogaya cf. arnoldii]